MEEQKIKQDIRIGANIRRIRKNRGIKPMALVRLLQLEGVEITRESLVNVNFLRDTKDMRNSTIGKQM